MNTSDVPFRPIKVSDLDMAFGGDVKRLMPPGIDYKWNGKGWGAALFNKLFFSGGNVEHLSPRPGIDKATALRHIRAVMGSFEPKHENKEAAVAWMFETWFVDTTQPNADPTLCNARS